MFKQKKYFVSIMYYHQAIKKTAIFVGSLTPSQFVDFNFLLNGWKKNFKLFYISATRALSLNLFRSYIEYKLKVIKRIFAKCQENKYETYNRLDFQNAI